MTTAKDALKRVIPKRFHPKAFFARWIFRKCGGAVRLGPFRGMKYVRRSVGSALSPKLLGLYEREIGAIIQDLCAARFATIIDVGAAEGYYAVGLALRSPSSRVVAFESEAGGRALIREMAELNGVSERVEIRGHCHVRELRDLTGQHPRSLVVMDVEGEEAALLDPALVPHLATCHILVELHDFISREIPTLIRARFSATHHIREEWTADRSLDDLPFAVPLLRRFFSRWLLTQITDERPEKMRWFYMEPRSAG